MMDGLILGHATRQQMAARIAALSWQVRTCFGVQRERCACSEWQPCDYHREREAAGWTGGVVLDQSGVVAEGDATINDGDDDAGRRHWRRARESVRRALADGAAEAHATILTRRGQLVGMVNGWAGDPELGWQRPIYRKRGPIGPAPRGSFTAVRPTKELTA